MSQRLAWKSCRRHTPYGQGVGALGTTVLGVLLFQESVNVVRLASIGLVVVGIAGLKLSFG
jgi:quaternary ammonium compound-resistance protein SugE